MKAGLVERYLYAKDVSRSQVTPRLILRCLQSLEERVGAGDRADAQSSQNLLRILEENLS